jgi:hypothetical protein
MAQEETSMKKGMGLIILLFLTVVVTVIFIYTDEPKEEDKSNIVVGSTNRLLLIDKNDIEEVMIYNRENYNLVKNQNQWQVKDKNFDLDQAKADSIAFYAANLYPQKEIEGASDLKQYGLDKPQGTLKISANNKNIDIFIGDKSPVGSGYYLKVNSSDKVYIVSDSIAASFLMISEDLRDRSLPVINVNNMTNIKITYMGETPIELIYNENQSENDKIYGLNAWKMIRPYSNLLMVDEARLENFKINLNQIQIFNFLDKKGVKLDEYGLVNPMMELTIKDDENKELSLQFGKETSEAVYFKLKNNNNVYTMRKNIYNGLKIDAFDIAQKFCFIENIYKVDKIILESGNKSYEIKLSKEEKKEGQKEDFSLKFNINGKEINEQTGRELYTALVSIVFEGEMEVEVSENPIIKTTFYIKDNDVVKEVNVNYVDYDKNFYAVFKDGKSDFISSKVQLDNLFKNLEDLIK